MNKNADFSRWTDHYISLVYEGAVEWLKANAGLVGSCRFAQMIDLRDQSRAEYERRNP
jgi:hypothetical protein